MPTQAPLKIHNSDFYLYLIGVSAYLSRPKYKGKCAKVINFKALKEVPVDLVAACVVHATFAEDGMLIYSSYKEEGLGQQGVNDLFWQSPLAFNDMAFMVQSEALDDEFPCHVPFAPEDAPTPLVAQFLGQYNEFIPIRAKSVLNLALRLEQEHIIDRQDAIHPKTGENLNLIEWDAGYWQHSSDWADRDVVTYARFRQAYDALGFYIFERMDDLGVFLD